MFSNLFLSSQYIPNGHCYLWQTKLVWLHVASDSLIAIAYFSIPITLFYFVSKRQDNPFQPIIILFSLFIFSCGTTHLMSIWTLWHPSYWQSGIIKAITALVSAYTAVELISFFPQALNLPDSQALEQANQDLAIEIESRRKVEQELEQEKSFLKATLEQLSVGVVACDREGVLTLFNQASQEMFGTLKPLPPAEWSKHYNLFQPDGKTYVPEADLPLSRAFAGETFANVELTVIPEGSQPRLLMTNGCPIINAEGVKQGAVVTVRDINQFRQTEKRLKQSNAELLQSNQELEKFAYVASHDLREPLRMVTSFTQLLARRYSGQLDSEADTIIGFAVDGAKRMEGLIEDLMLYSRVGKQNKPLEIADCNFVVQKVLANLQLLTKETNTVVQIKPLPSIVCDEIQLTQLFQNLITNAVTYRSELPLTIKIEAVSQERGWLFSVEDNGIGIPPENARRIFEVFQRLHPKEQYSGNGIGLAICKKIVERHSGEIWVESALGNGATFKFTLNTQNFDRI